jgi:hypothetical protein
MVNLEGIHKKKYSDFKLLTVWYTYLLTPYSKVLPEKLKIPQLVRKFSAFNEPLKAHYRTYNSPPVILILSQIDPIHALSHFSKVYFNIIIASDCLVCAIKKKDSEG